MNFICRLLVLLLIAVLIVISSYVVLVSHATTMYTISVGDKAHADYGLSYPITYEFATPPTSSNLSAYYCYGNSCWIKLPEKSYDDFFNDLQCVRFDYSKNIAYVSIAFSFNNDEIYVQIKNAYGHPVSIKYLGTAPWYDDRRCAVVVTVDDYIIGSTKLLTYFQERRIWLSLGCMRTRNERWSDLQPYVNEGYLEIDSHSRTHQSIPYWTIGQNFTIVPNYRGEINGSKQDLLNSGLNFSSLYRKGNTQYLYAWFEPYGEIDDNARLMLGESKYLCDRTGSGSAMFPKWDSISNLYERCYCSTSLDNSNVTELNAAFDKAYDSGSFYLAYFHPMSLPWTSENGTLVLSENSYVIQHLNYIANRQDVWYVGIGAMFLYRYTETVISVAAN